MEEGEVKAEVEVEVEAEVEAELFCPLISHASPPLFSSLIGEVY